MSEFIRAEFLLDNKTAEKLYFDYAADMPIIDYHNHLPPAEIAADQAFDNITAMWLKGDHYKWRAMRANGIGERFITGDAGDYEKFEAWAKTVPYTLRNPLFHWTQMELANPFGIKELLNPASAKEIYESCNSQLSRWTPRNLLSHYKVTTLCTTDDPCDSLAYHRQLAAEGFQIQVLPTFRADKLLSLQDLQAYNDYLAKLSASSGISIGSFDQLMEALYQRHQYFHDNGCRLSDNGMDTFYAADFDKESCASIFSKIRKEEKLSAVEIDRFRAAIMYHICTWNHEKAWTQQFHVGPIRNNNSRLLRLVGADAGTDSIGDWLVAAQMSKFFDQLDNTDQLARTVVYNLNPAHNEVYAGMVGNFQDGKIPGKMQYGAAWWFLDQEDGIEKQLNVLSNFGLLSRFVGMLTDSRSFLSFSRHDYFRRILCNLIGRDVESGRLPADLPWMGSMIQDICYHNAKSYFNFPCKQ